MKMSVPNMKLTPGFCPKVPRWSLSVGHRYSSLVPFTTPTQGVHPHPSVWGGVRLPSAPIRIVGTPQSCWRL